MLNKNKENSAAFNNTEKKRMFEKGTQIFDSFITAITLGFFFWFTSYSRKKDYNTTVRNTVLGFVFGLMVDTTMYLIKNFRNDAI